MQEIEQIAILDANLYVQKVGKIFKELIYIFTEIDKEFVWEWVDKMPPEEVFSRFFSGFNLSGINNIYLHQNLPPEIKEQLFPYPAINLKETIKLVFTKAYKFGDGENIKEEYLRYFLNYVDIYLNLIHIYYPAFKGRPIRNSEDSMLKNVSETFAINTSLIKSRKYLEEEYMRFMITNTPASVPIRVITDFTNISHQGVLKNIHSSNITATKVKNNWQIPVQDAVNFLKSREDCPKWILNL